jgi:hypothetical protein
MSAGHSETLSKHLTGVLYVGQKNILFCLFFFFLGHFREDIYFGGIIYLERPCLKPTPPCSAAASPSLQCDYRFWSPKRAMYSHSTAQGSGVRHEATRE